MASSGKADGEKYLAANKAKDGVKVTASGLQYKILTPGTGAIPKATDTVVTHYTGTLIDGKVFDSSYKRNSPATFPVNGVIKRTGIWCSRCRRKHWPEPGIDFRNRVTGN